MIKNDKKVLQNERKGCNIKNVRRHKTYQEGNTMTRFVRELNGDFGEFWKKNAEQDIVKMQKRADAGEIEVDENGAAFWVSSNNYLPEDCAEMLSYTDFIFDIQATAEARDKQTNEFLEEYRKNYKGPSEEEKAEMRAAFGEGAEIVDVITGKTIRL